MTRAASPDLPPALRAALEARLQGFSRNDAAERAAAISKTYRDGGDSGAIRIETDALAYALARMPATYAAVVASLNALCEIRPDFSPKSLLDVGAGPGHRDMGCGASLFRRCKTSRCSMPTTPCACWRSILRRSARLRDISYERGEARAALAKRRSGRSRRRKLCDRRD